MHIYYLEMENIPKLSEFGTEYCLLEHLVTRMAITGCKPWDFLYKTTSMKRNSKHDIFTGGRAKIESQKSPPIFSFVNCISIE